MVDFNDKPEHIAWDEWSQMSESEKEHELDVDDYIHDGEWPDENQSSEDE